MDRREVPVECRSTLIRNSAWIGGEVFPALSLTAQGGQSFTQPGPFGPGRIPPNSSLEAQRVGRSNRPWNCQPLGPQNVILTFVSRAEWPWLDERLAPWAENLFRSPVCDCVLGVDTCQPKARATSSQNPTPLHIVNQSQVLHAASMPLKSLRSQPDRRWPAASPRCHAWPARYYRRARARTPEALQTNPKRGSATKR